MEVYMQLTEKNFEKLHKTVNIIDKFVELQNLIRLLTSEEYDLLICSLEKSLKEAENR